MSAGSNLPVLSPTERERLRGFARAGIVAAVGGGAEPAFGAATEALEGRFGAFVTLTLAGRLRGCIGVTSSRDPLWKTVGRVAVCAALRDPRFPPVSPEELADLELEISVLSRSRPVRNAREIRLGRHGVLLRCGRASGFFLPKVATERGWSVEELLENLALKAGVPGDEWKKGDLFVFDVEVL